MIDQELCGDFKAFAIAIKSSTASSLFGRAANQWVTERLEESNAPKEFKEVLRKTKLATASTAHGLLGSIQM